MAQTLAIGKRKKGKGPATHKQAVARKKSQERQAKADFPADDERKPRRER